MNQLIIFLLMLIDSILLVWQCWTYVYSDAPLDNSFVLCLIGLYLGVIAAIVSLIMVSRTVKRMRNG